MLQISTLRVIVAVGIIYNSTVPKQNYITYQCKENKNQYYLNEDVNIIPLVPPSISIYFEEK
jgi:hypothetical protein